MDPYTVGAVTEGPRPNNANSLSPCRRDRQHWLSGCGHQRPRYALQRPGYPRGQHSAALPGPAQPGHQGGSKTERSWGRTQAEVTYSAAANPNDPILSQPVNPGTGWPFTGITGNSTDVYKTNFWDLAFQAYDPFYPPGVLGSVPTTRPIRPRTPTSACRCRTWRTSTSAPTGRSTDPVSAATAFSPPFSMPCLASLTPIWPTAPQVAEEHYTNKPFFVELPLRLCLRQGQLVRGRRCASWPPSTTSDAKIPTPSFRYRPAPRPAQPGTGAVLATVDTVLPISGEASCKNCHGSPFGVPDKNANKGKGQHQAGQRPGCPWLAVSTIRARRDRESAGR